MPGENCAVFGCGSCRRTKGIGIWKLPLAKDEAHAKWREEWLSEIKKTREIDQNFRELIKHDRVYTCEKHFVPEDIEIFTSVWHTSQQMVWVLHSWCPYFGKQFAFSKHLAICGLFVPPLMAPRQTEGFIDCTSLWMEMRTQMCVIGR